MYFDIDKLKKEQSKLAKRISTSVEFEKADILGGCDFANGDNTIICSIVVYDAKEKKVVDRQIISLKEEFPYISSFLFYRVGPAAIEAYHRLAVRPDILFVKGHGICHPRGIGIASHLGLVLDVPTIGVADKLLYGEVREDGYVYIDDERVGASVQTREFSKAIIVSPGHCVNLKTAIELARKSCIPPHKLPEPLHLAHKLATKGQSTSEKDINL